MRKKFSEAGEMFRLSYPILGAKPANTGAQTTNIHTQPASLHFQLAHEACDMDKGRTRYPAIRLPARATMELPFVVPNAIYSATHNYAVGNAHDNEEQQAKQYGGQYASHLHLGKDGGKHLHVLGADA